MSSAPTPAATVETRATGELTPDASTSAPAPAPAVGVRLIAISALFTLAVACAGYWWTGTPAALNADMYAGGGGATEASEAQKVAEFSGMVEKLRERMDKEPAAEGLGMLGRSYLILGKPDEAVAAYQRALKLEPQNASLLADLADAMGVRNNNSLSGPPKAFIEQALRIDPKNLKALMLAGSEAYDRNDFAQAVGYWQQMESVGPADHPLVKQAALAVAETRKQMTGGAAGSTAPAVAAAAASAATPAPSGTSGAASSGSVSGTVKLNAALAASASPDDSVFIFARPADGSRMPLAILRRQVKDLPLSFTLDDSLAMSPAAKLSSAQRVIVGARISKSGNAMPQPGDLEGLTEAVSVGSGGLQVEISRVVR
ncbi:MAG: c-type cytochrome biogenesis protein CcmI/CycH [Rubrivivax sp.]